MNTKIWPPILMLLLLSLIAFVLYACQPRDSAHQRTNSPAEAKTSTSDQGEPGTDAQTGQKDKSRATGDGHLKAGKTRPGPRFTLNGKRTVTDNRSGLMWTRNADQANGKASWEKAMSGAKRCTEGGYQDWRLPDRNELQSLIDADKFNPALPDGYPFTGIQSSYYWTSHTTAHNEHHAWIIHIYIGYVTHDDKLRAHHAWYVRGR